MIFACSHEVVRTKLFWTKENWSAAAGFFGGCGTPAFSPTF